MPDDQRSRAIERLALISATVVAIITLIIFSWFFYTTKDNPNWNKVEFEHFPVTVALPTAGVGAFLVVVMLFRITEGEIKIRFLGLTLEGAAGPIVMWVLCYLAMTASIKLLW
jgi:hypothetical protein